MLTPEDIDAQIRAEHPEFVVNEDGEDLTISPESDPDRYEQMIAERVAWRIEQQERDTIQADEDARAEQMKARYQALKAGTATARQTQEVVAHLLRQQYRDLEP